ncbi:hypothetical protein BKA65DRAFT_220890 [Rhexocercosporidium sp. MPI-PUGE-AT-0058]|nr:hypothetical protein BKA65DRAFT_220890 [Rhexocercosporidium sp. MPI-PUGE-AT-0058]
MAPLTPHWEQPSHPSIQEVILPSNPTDFTTKSLSKISLPPHAVFAKFDFPPCTKTDKPTYATVQMGKNEHLNLNSDLVYINHSCEPSLIFDLAPESLSILAGPKGLKPGDELTFFYPSTEWDMAQGFDCFCGAETCRGFISGAKTMRKEQLEGLWLNAHIRTLLSERDSSPSSQSSTLSSTTPSSDAPSSTTQSSTSKYLSNDPSSTAPSSNTSTSSSSTNLNGAKTNGSAEKDEWNGEQRRGVTSRELSGEMGGDTVV